MISCKRYVQNPCRNVRLTSKPTPIFSNLKKVLLKSGLASRHSILAIIPHFLRMTNGILHDARSKQKHSDLLLHVHQREAEQNHPDLGYERDGKRNETTFWPGKEKRRRLSLSAASRSDDVSEMEEFQYSRDFAKNDVRIPTFTYNLRKLLIFGRNNCEIVARQSLNKALFLVFLTS